MCSKAEPVKVANARSDPKDGVLPDNGGPPLSVHQCLFLAYYGSRTNAVNEKGVLHVSRSLHLSGESDINN